MKKTHALFFLLAMLVSVGAGCFNRNKDKTTDNSSSTKPDVAAVQNPEERPYSNSRYGFSLDYPAGSTETFRQDDSENKLLSVAVGATSVSSTAVAIPDLTFDLLLTDSHGSNLVAPAYLKDGCYYGLGEHGESPKEIDIAGKKACLVQSMDAGAGNYYNSYWYAVPLEDGKVLVLSFLIHSLSCGNFENPGSCVPFDKQRDDAFVERIASSLKFSKSQPAQVHFETKSITSSTTGYAIDFDYPVLVGASQEAVSKVEQTIESFVTTTTQVFLESAKENADYQSGVPGGQFMLESDYSVMKFSESVYDVIFHGYLYTGGAHGMPIIRTFIFDVSTGDRIELSDLFKPGTDFLKTIAVYAEQEIIKRDVSEPDWIKSGTEPKPENYQDYYLTKDGLMIVFPPYQVAAYAAGPQEVLIPFLAIKGILNEQYLK